MANIKINELPEINEPKDSDILIVDNGTATGKVTKTNLLKTTTTAINNKQDKLVSGTNIKTINNQSIVGSGNVTINAAVWGNITGTITNQSDLITYISEHQGISGVSWGAISGNIESQTDLVNTFAKKSSLATVATSGKYSDLTGKPTVYTKTETDNAIAAAIGNAIGGSY